MEKIVLEKQLAKVRNGAYIKIHFVRKCETYKKFGDLGITKETSSVVRLGVIYSHIQDEKVQDRVKAAKARVLELGETYEANKLPWGQWVPGSKYLIEHKDKYYLRCTLSRSPKHRPSVIYAQHGEAVRYNDIEQCLTANEKSKNNDVVFVIPLDSIISIGKQD